MNTLIFDEPTNHIDIPTREALEEAIGNFKGTLLIVSHDRFFIDKFAGKTIEIEDGKTITYTGNYKNYLAKKMRQYSGLHRKADAVVDCDRDPV